MCGIIAVVRRPTDRTPPAAAEVLGLLDAASTGLAALGSTFDARPLAEAAAQIAGADQLLRGVPGVLALVARPRPVRRGRAPGPGAGRPGAGDRRGPRPGRRRCRGCRRRRRPRGAQRGHGRAEGRGLGHRARPAAHGPGGRGARRPRRRATRPSRSSPRCSRRCRPSTGSRSAAATRPACTCWSAATASTSTPPTSRLALARAGPPTRCSGRWPCAPPTATSASSTRRRPRSASWATTRGRCGPPIAGDALLRRALAADTARGGRARPHPLGQRRHHLPGQRPPPELRGDRPRRRALRDRRAQRRRRQLRRPQGHRGAAHPGRDHHRRQGDPDAHVAAPGRGHRRGRGLPPHRRRARGLGGHRRQRQRAPGDLLLALRGSGQALYVGLAEDAFLVASEPYGLVEETATYLRMDGETPADPATQPPGARSSAPRAPRPARSRASSGWPTTARPIPVAADELATAQITTRDIDRGDSPHFLLKEISEAPASFRKTLRGKLVEVDGELVVKLPADTLPDDVRADLRAGTDQPGAGHRPGHRRRRRPEPGRGAGRRPRRRAARRCGPCSPPSCRASTSAPTCPTRSSSPSASRAPPPTPTAPSTSSGPAAPG